MCRGRYWRLQRYKQQYAIFTKFRSGLDARARARFAGAMKDHCARGGMIVAATHEPLGLEDARALALGGAAPEARP